MSTMMKVSWLAVVVLPALVMFLNRDKEVGRVPFSGEGSHTAGTVLSAGKVAFWTDIDVQYKGSAELEYRIALTQGGTQVATATCYPLGYLSTKFVWIEIDKASSHSRRGSGKMDCSATLRKGGPTTVDVTLAFTVRPPSATTPRVDLVLKQ